MYMRKIISIICICATMLFLFGNMIVFASSGGDFQLDISKETVSRGDEFSVTVNLKNNPGVWSIAFEIPIDENMFEFIEADTSTSIFSQFGVCKYDETTQSYKFNAYHTDLFSDVTKNGTLVILTLKVKDDARLGSVEFSALADEENIVNCNEEKVTIQTNNVLLTVQEDIPSSTIDSADMVLGTDIRVNYYAILDPSHVGAQMRFTMNGAETLVDGVATEDEGVYVYSFENLAPQCMGDNIKAELILGDAILDVEEEYSVKTYCENTLSQSAAELGMSAEKYAAMRTLIADMLEYGAKAQVYLNYKTDSLVNEGVTEQSEFVALNPEDCDEILEQSGNFTLTGVEFVSAGVYFDYYNALYVKFKAPNVTDSNFRVRLKDGEENILATYKLSECELISEESSTYVLVLPALSATQFEDFYIIELCKYTSRATTMQWSLNYGVSSYVCAKQNKTDAEGNLTPMAELARATYNYGLSASAYNAIAN